MKYHSKVFVCFDLQSDADAFEIMRTWRQSDGTLLDLHHVDHAVWDKAMTLYDEVPPALVEQMSGSTIMIALVGAQSEVFTKLFGWEEKECRRMGIPIIVANLNRSTRPTDDANTYKVEDYPTVHVSFEPGIIQHALSVWPEQFTNYRRRRMNHEFYYWPNVYADLKSLVSSD